MTTAAARPADLAAFESAVQAAREPVTTALTDLQTALVAARVDDVLRWVGSIGRLEDEVAELNGEDADLARWVGDVGEAFRTVDAEGEVVTSTDTRIVAATARLGDGEVTVRHVGDQIIVDTGDGDDEVTVSEEEDGGLVVTVNGTRYEVDANTRLTVRAGSGVDTVTVPSGAEVAFTIDGGTDDDHISGGDGGERVYGSTGDDTIEVGAGADMVDGGDGRDYVDGYEGSDTLVGGRGNDVTYGGGGDDTLLGGGGRDYLDGGTGADSVVGGAQADVVSGGDGDDHLAGGGGDDVLYAGTGADTVLDLGGANTAHVESGDQILEGSGLATTRVTVDLSDLPDGAGIRIEGSPEFVQRVEADLATLAASPVGIEMLRAMDDIHQDTQAIAAGWPLLGRVAYQGDVVVIREYDEPNGGASYTDYILWRTNGIQYNPRHSAMYGYDSPDTATTLNWREAPPIAILQHELAHQYDYGYETGAEGDYTLPDDPDVPNREREAVGLPMEDGELAEGHPFTYTENGLREEMGLPERGSYGPTAP